MADRTHRPMRFGVVAPLLTDVPAWQDQARRIADAGYSVLLMPDVPHMQPAPAPALATVAAITDLRVGSWVYASPLRPAWLLAWEAHSLTQLTGGRFEFGIGVGRPGIADEVRRLRGPEPTSTPLEVVRETVAVLRELDGDDVRTPVALAVNGPRGQALAAEIADTVTFAAMPGASRGDIAAIARGFRAERDIELAMHISVVGDTLAPFMGPPDLDPARLRAEKSLLIVPSDPAETVDELLRRRDELGFTYFVFGANSAHAMAPVVAELAGR